MADKSVEDLSLTPPTRNPWQLTFEALDLPDQGLLRLPYNPESISIKASPNWEQVMVAGAERPRSIWTHNSPREISWNHTLHVGPGLTLGTEAVLITLEDWATSIVLETQRPTRVRLTLGDARQYVGHIDSFTYDTRLIRDDGFILVAEYSITFKENPE